MVLTVRQITRSLETAMYKLAAAGRASVARVAGVPGAGQAVTWCVGTTFPLEGAASPRRGRPCPCGGSGVTSPLGGVVVYLRVNEIGIPPCCSGPRWRLARSQSEVAHGSAALGKPYLTWYGTVSTSPAARLLRGDQDMTTAPAVSARAREGPVAYGRIAVLVGVLFLSFTVALFIGNSLIYSISSA
jgi:hypothetical protein